MPKGREEVGPCQAHGHRGHHNHQDAARNARRHAGHKRVQKLTAKREHGERPEQEGPKHKTDRGEPQKERDDPYSTLLHQKEP